jgi:diguanylate cyclase (GGDEF)-like protein
MLTVPTNDVELVQAQFRAFAKKIPILYLVIVVNTMIVASSFVRFGPLWLSLYVPASLCLFCIVRAIRWWRIGQAEWPFHLALRRMQTANKLAVGLALAYFVWSAALYRYGDASAQSEIIFSLALSMISSLCYLGYLRSAALGVTVAGVIPTCLFFLFADGGHFRAITCHLALVSLGLNLVLTLHYRDFAHLVRSRRDLRDKQRETQTLSDENFRLANIDSLTGLPNRRALMTKLNAVHDTSREGGLLTAIVSIDLDDFKHVNDTYGHEAGEKLISIVARRFEGSLTEGAMLARLGGDEFGALISAPGADELAKTYAAIVVDLLREPIHIGERTLQVTASVGVSFASRNDCDAEELFRRADIAIFNVKANGKAGVKVYSAELDSERLRLQRIECHIRDGLARGEFEVYYQPIVLADTKAVVGAEALVRWPRRAGPAISPDQFIPVAETTGLIHPLGLFVLRRACLDLLEIPGLKVSVNVSPVQFDDPEFEAKVVGILTETGFPAARLELELTEGYLIDHPQRATGAIASLKAMGVSIALDDFGTGYSSIGYLRRYGFNRIKIDKSLTSEITSDPKANVLINGTVYLAEGLGMEVTAEGVETEEQESLLQLAGCRYLQGFRYYRPKPIDKLIERLRSGAFASTSAASAEPASPLPEPDASPCSAPG